MAIHQHTILLATSCKFISSGGDTPQEGIKPYLMDDWGSIENMGDEDEPYTDFLTWANVEVINSEQTAKDI